MEETACDPNTLICPEDVEDIMDEVEDFTQKMSRAHVDQLVVLVLKSVLGSSRLRRDVPGRTLEDLYEVITTTCLLHGLNSFLSDLLHSGGDLLDVVDYHNTNALHYIRSLASNVHAYPVEKMNEDEKSLIDFITQTMKIPPYENEDDCTEVTRRNSSRQAATEPAKETFQRVLEEARRTLLNDANFLKRIKDEVNPYLTEAQQEALAAELRSYLNDGHPIDEEARFSVVCPQHKKVPLPNKLYVEQLLEPDKGWKCPKCGTKSELFEGEGK